MHELLHIIGLCPENLASQNLINIFILNYQDIINIFNKSYDKTRL